MTKIDYEPIGDDKLKPICPYCEKGMDKISYFEQSGLIKSKVVRIMVCPHCLKVLGTGMVGW